MLRANRQFTRGLHPGVLVTAWIAKKLSLVGIAQVYGYPRLYRRIMEVNRNVAQSQEEYDTVRDAVQLVFRLPTEAAKRIEQNTGMMKVLSQFENRMFSSESKPGFLMSAVYSVIKQTDIHKAIKRYEAEVKRAKLDLEKESDKSGESAEKKE